MKYERMLCPKCGKRTMIRKKLTDGKYSLVCETCGATRGEFKPDKKKGVA